MLLFVAGTGSDLAVDAIGAGPYGLLMTNLDMGYGSRPWAAPSLIPEVSSFWTLWNVKSQVKASPWKSCQLRNLIISAFLIASNCHHTTVSDV
jgi:hypothetical protein